VCMYNKKRISQRTSSFSLRFCSAEWSVSMAAKKNVMYLLASRTKHTTYWFQKLGLDGGEAIGQWWPSYNKKLYSRYTGSTEREFPYVSVVTFCFWFSHQSNWFALRGGGWRMWRVPIFNIKWCSDPHNKNSDSFRLKAMRILTNWSNNDL